MFYETCIDVQIHINRPQEYIRMYKQLFLYRVKKVLTLAINNDIIIKQIYSM